MSGGIGMEKDRLSRVGIDYDDGVNRLLGNAEMYESFLEMFTTDDTFPTLEQAMKDQDYENAFTSAHTLKGVAGNLGMKTFYDKLVVFVDKLRKGADIPGAVAEFPEIQKMYLDIKEAIEA